MIYLKIYTNWNKKVILKKNILHYYIYNCIFIFHSISYTFKLIQIFTIPFYAIMIIVILIIYK